MYKIGRTKIVDDETAACRTGVLISLGGLIIAGITVHFWTQLYAFFMFLLGSAVWMIDRTGQTTSGVSSANSDLTPPRVPNRLLGRRVLN